MRVKELIEKLQELDPELPVCKYDRMEYETELSIYNLDIREGTYYDEEDIYIKGKFLMIV